MRKAIFFRTTIFFSFLLALFAAGLFTATSVSAQVSINTTLTTGTMSGSVANAYRTAYLHFQLVNCGDNIPVIPGQPSAVAQDAFDLYPATPGSAVIGSILGNDQMTCGNVVSTYYVVSVMKDASHPLRGGIPYVICSASATLGTCSNQASLGAFNLVTADPMTSPPPAPGFSQLYENPTNSQTWTQPLGTVGNFLGSFDFVNGIFVGSTLVADLPALVGLSNVIYVSDGTAGTRSLRRRRHWGLGLLSRRGMDVRTRLERRHRADSRSLQRHPSNPRLWHGSSGHNQRPADRYPDQPLRSHRLKHLNRHAHRYECR